MPSIPQSLLWISLVVLWLFVLVPMLINKRDAVRRTSDVALATRVLTSGSAARLIKRSGPAAGHRSDPHWRPEPGGDADHADEHELVPARAVVVRTAPADVDGAESGYLDVDVIEDGSGALPAGAGTGPAETAGSADAADHSEPEDHAPEPEGEYEYETEDVD